MKKLSAKILAVALSAFIAAVPLGACSSNGSTGSGTDSKTQSTASENQEESSEPAPEGVVELDFWNGFTGSDGAILEQIVAKFNEKYDGQFKVNMDIMSWDVFYQKFNPSIASGTAPNFVIASQNKIPMYADNGTYQEIGDLFTDYDVDESNILQSFLDCCKYEDQYYATPMFNGFLSLWYNKDLLAEAGYDQPPKTMDELFEYAKAMTDSSKGQYGLSVETTWISPSLLIWSWNNGGDAISEAGEAVWNSEENVEIFTELQKLVREDGISPVGINFDESVKLYLGGNLAMFYCGPWILQDVLDSGLNYGVTGFPGDVQYGYTSCFGVTTANTDTERDGCMKFLEFFYSDEIQLFWSLESGFPTYSKSVMEMAEYKENDVQASIAPYLEDAKIFMVDAPNADVIYNDILWPSFQEIIVGGEDVKGSLDAANEELTGWIDENLK